MQIARGKSVAAVAAAVVVVLGISASSWATTMRSKIHAGLHSSVHSSLHSSTRTSIHSSTRSRVKPVVMTGEEVVPGVMPQPAPTEETSSGTADRMPTDTENPDTKPAQTSLADGKPYKLRMSNLHTGETLDIVYRIGNTYIPQALEKLNYFLRDHNTQDVVDYSPKEFDVLHAVMSRLGRANGLIDIVCGYRTPETNAALRRDSPQTGVAEHSQHMEGHAIDIRVPGVSTVQLRNAALSLHAGGVGYYPVSQFVHVDVGPVREWAFGATPRRAGHRHSHRTSVGM